MVSSLEYCEGGYDYEFVDTLMDSLVCKICHYPSREPHLSVCCGHTFCNSCLKNAKKSTVLSDACPMCRTEQFTTVPNKQNERAVLSLHVHCTNNKRGCGWIGEVGNITSHLRNSSGCKFEMIRCQNNCGKTFERQYLPGHVEKECPRRRTKCQYCQVEGEYQFIEGSHKQQCYKYPVPCPNKCEIKNVPSEYLKEHRKVCPLEIVQCQYSDIGCGAKMARKDLVKHDEDNTNEHLLLMKSTLIDTQNKLVGTQKRLAAAENKLADTENKLSVTENKLNDTQNKLAARLTNTEYSLADIRDDLNDTEEKLADTEERLASAEWKLTANHAEVSAKVAQADFRKNFEIGNVQVRLQNKIDELEATLKQKTKLFDLFFGEWPIKIHTRAAKLSSCNQLLPVIVKVPDFMMNKENKVDWYSDPFFTHHQGYKIRLNVVPAGWDTSEDCYMSVYLYILDGPFDHLLKWKLKGRFEVKLLNQICDSEHHSMSYQNRADRSQSPPFWFCEKFISHEDLMEISATCQFVKDDCVFFEVSRLQ